MVRSSDQSPYSNRALDAQNLRFRFGSLPYGRHLLGDAWCASMDMIRIKFTMSNHPFDYVAHRPLEPLQDVYRQLALLDWSMFFDSEFAFVCTRVYNHSFTIGKYSTVLTFEFLNGAFSVLMGRYVYDSSHLCVAECVAEWNPNKILDRQAAQILRVLHGCSVDRPEVMRFDAAFDFPFDREAFQILPVAGARFDDRFYPRTGHTTYIRERHSHGAVKLYDKTKESGLEVPVTRCEITIHAAKFKSIADVFPDLRFAFDIQMSLAQVDLPFEVQACILYPDLLSVLKKSKSSNTYRKLKRMVDSFSGQQVAVDFPAVDDFFRKLCFYYLDLGVLHETNSV